MTLPPTARFGRWEEALSAAHVARFTALRDATGRPEHIVTVTTLHYARGVAHAALGNAAEAREEQQLFAQAYGDLKARDAAVGPRTMMNNHAAVILAVAEKVLRKA